MKAQEKEALKEKIGLQIIETEQKLLELEKDAQPIAPENSIGRISRMDAINNKSVVDAAIRKMKERLAKLRFALTKADTEHFGICSMCKNPIPPMRLMFMPESTRCVRCADR